MKKFRLVLATAVLMGFTELPCLPGQSNPASAPRFKDFAVRNIFHGKPARPVLTRYEEKVERFRNVILATARRGPNFAGRYTIVELGCGSGCDWLLILDAVSGRSYAGLPFVLEIPYQGTVSGCDYKGYVYRLNSSLLVADGCPDYSNGNSNDISKIESNCETRYYKWEQNRFVLVASAPVPAATKPQGYVPQFEDFPAGVAFHGKPAEPVFISGETSYVRFRPKILEGARNGPNFAGHYTIVRWGCGPGCISFVIVDAISGRIYPPPILFADHPLLRGTAGGSYYTSLEYRRDSSLLVANGCMRYGLSKAEKLCEAVSYKWEDNRLAVITKHLVSAEEDWLR